MSTSSNTTRSAKEKKASPGIAFGGENLPVIRGQWLRGTHANAGRFPGQVATNMRGRKFDNWSQFRKEFWLEVARHQELLDQFDASGQTNMQRGHAPAVVLSQRTISGANPPPFAKKYNLHHIKEVAEGGGVYDLGNLHVVSPLYHLKTFHD